VKHFERCDGQRAIVGAVGENRPAFDKARSVLLVADGGEPSDAQVFRKHAAEDRDTVATREIGWPAERSRFRCRIERERDKCLKTLLEEHQFRVFYANAR
jgi:hypothetical protein